MRRRKQRIRPMPTEEDKRKAQLKAAGADPLVWAMKKVDDEFPDSREKSEKTIKDEMVAEMLDDDDFSDVDAAVDAVASEGVDTEEIQAEGKLTMPMGEGVMTMEVTPQRQSIDDISEEEVAEIKNNRRAEKEPEVEEPKRVMKGFRFGRHKAEDESTGESAYESEVLTKNVEARRNEAKRAEAVCDEDKPAESKKHADAKVGSTGRVVNMVKRAPKMAQAIDAAGENGQVDHKTQIQLTALEAKQKKMMLGFIALVVLALGGVVFGVVAVVSQKNASEDLENKIVTSVNIDENLVDDNYIYLKDWKMKIKLVSGLEHVSFDYDNDEYSSVMIWGARKNPGSDYTPDFAKQSKNSNPLGIVTRVPRYERAAAGRLIWYDDYYNYYYQGPSGEPEADESEMSWWVESYLLIKEMLTNADNYMKFEDSAIGKQ